MIATIIASAKLIGIAPSLLLGLCSVESSLQNIVNKLIDALADSKA